MMLARVVRATKGAKHGRVTEELHGYDVEAFKAHIEAQFEGWMSWDNYGDWHIDHVVPVVRFLRQGVTDPRIINALPNLRPLERAQNLSRPRA
jgi:hypothetical protein